MVNRRNGKNLRAIRLFLRQIWYMDFNDIVSVSGRGGLFKVIRSTRTGVVLETMDGQKKRMVMTMHHKISVLKEISIYTTGSGGACPLEEVMKKIHREFNGDMNLTGNSDAEELKSFLKFILPEFDESRVYISDIKKLVNWYNQLVKEAPEALEDKQEDRKVERKKTTRKEEEESE